MESPQQVSMTVTLKQTQEIECPQCGGIFFKQSVLLRKVPALLTGQPKDSLLPIAVFRCEDCGEVVKESLPPGLSLEEEPEATPEPPKSKLIL